MAKETIKCPNCGFDIEISEILTHQIEERLKKDFEDEVKKREKELDRRASELERIEGELKEASEEIDERIAEKLKEKEEELGKEAENKARESLKVELDDLKSAIEEKDKKIKDSQMAELELRKKARELESKKDELELEVARKIDEERENIRQEALKQFGEEHYLKDLQKDKRIQDLMKMLEDAKRKAEQASMEAQGEVLELDLEGALKSAFPTDNINPVPKGMRGADVVHEVFSDSHQLSGIILWEAKHTKNWSNKWIEKLKDDQREVSADIAVIASRAMPKEIENFGLMDGIWITNLGSVLGLATALREQLIDVSFAKLSAVGKKGKMEALYHYLSGPEFRQKVEAIVETFTMMNDQLDKEKRAMQRIWKEREKHIQRITVNTVGMYGEMRGIIGAALPEIEALELGPIERPKELEEGNKK